MKTIVWDVDDVLNDLMRAWFEDWAARDERGRALSYDRLCVNPPHELLGISRLQYLLSLDDFRLSGKAAQMGPVPEVFEWFCRYGDKARHVALTAVPLRTAHVSADWVMRHFGRWVRSFNVIPSPRTGEEIRYDDGKAGFLKWWAKADLLVDDGEKNIEGAAALGLRTLLFPRPWNREKAGIEDTLAALTDFVL